jgi:hypothetical protein
MNRKQIYRLALVVILLALIGLAWSEKVWAWEVMR